MSSSALAMFLAVGAVLAMWKMRHLEKTAMFWKIIAGVLAISAISETVAIFKWLGIL